MAQEIKLDEKYRPQNFADLIGNVKITQELAQKVKEKSIPHLLLSGPAGTGKTSTAHVLIKILYGGVIKRKFIEINASDDNGIDTIRTTVKDYAMRSGSQNEVDFRIIILDECDEMTAKAQASLRRIMEKYYKHCRFILICNYKWKIIDPIQSRCSCYDYAMITAEEMIPRLDFICKNENINIKPEALKFVAERSKGDMRTALNSYLEKVRNKNVEITIEMLKSIEIDSNSALVILKAGLNQKFVQARQYFYSAIRNGMNTRQIVNKMASISVEQQFPDGMKGDIALACLESEKLLLDGCTEELVIGGIIARFMKIGETY